MRITEHTKENISVTDLTNRILEGPEFQFEYDVKPSERFPIYKGKFILRFPTVGDEITANKLQAQLRGFVSPIAFDNYQNYVFEAISWLKTVTVGAPQWFVETNNGIVEAMPEKVADLDKLLEIYQAWMKWRNSFRVSGDGQSGGDQRGQSTEVAGTS